MFPTLFDLAIEERVPVIAFSFADPSPWVARAKDSGAKVICQVQSVSGAAEAVAAGTDVLVVQGNEAGGHTGRANMMPLLLRVLRDYPNIPVLAAGGIASGRGLAAVLAAGADGAWLGTALLSTHECVEVSDSYKHMLVNARSEDTLFTEIFDILDQGAFGIPPWPNQIAGRAIANKFVKRWHGAEDVLRTKIAEVSTAYQRALAENDLEGIAVWAGESVDFITEIRPVSDVIQSLCREADQLLGR
jgi:nitronate monooxygenase